MPVFRKENGSAIGFFSKARQARRRRLKNAVNIRAETMLGSRVYRRRSAYPWPVSSSAFSKIDARFNGQISAIIAKGTQDNPGRKFVIFDWGCGKRVAAKQLAKNKNLKVFGYAFEPHSSWRRPGGAELISTDKKFLVPYLKKRGVLIDLLYSYMGLNNLAVDELLQHLSELKGVVRIGGKIFFDFESSDVELIRRGLKKVGFSVKIAAKDNMYCVALTRVK